MITASRPYLGKPSEGVDAIVDLDDGRRIVGTVAGVREDLIVRATFSTLAAKHRLRAWLQLLALAAARPDAQWEAATIGKRKGGGRVARLSPVTAADAKAALTALVSIRDEGLCRPLPVSARASAAYAELRRKFDVQPCLEKAASEWRGSDYAPGDMKDAEHVLIYGSEAPFERLLAEPHDGPEQTRFGQLSRLVWDPLLAHEELADV
jgi:exodeoxyribonuclease V gamma subunit